jgi:hypothetical protein
MSHDNFPFTLKAYHPKNMLNYNVVKEITIFARPNINVCKFHVLIRVNIWFIVLCGLHMRQPQNPNKRLMVETITRKTKKEGQKKAKGHTTHRNQKKGKN